MIQELFLSLLSGLSALFGLNPQTPFFFLEKMGFAGNSAAVLACYGGLVNGLVLLYLKFRADLPEKKLLVFMALPILFYQIACHTYFNKLIVDLRLFTWVFAGFACCTYLFLGLDKNVEKYKIPVLISLAYISQIPGSTAILMLVLFLSAVRFPVRSAVLMVFLAHIPGFLFSFSTSAYEFLQDSQAVDWLGFSLNYLAACLGIYLSALGLMKVLKSGKPKIILNSCMGGTLALLFLTSRYGGTLSGEKVYRYSFPSMGTACEFTIWTNKKEEAESAVLKARELVDSIEAKLSTYKENSEINLMNNTAFEKAFKCSDTLWENLKVAEYAYHISNGGFDVTVGPLVKLWAVKKKRSQLPEKSEIEKTLKVVGFDKLEFNEKDRSVRFKVEGLKVDFGGLTKGWAVDMAAALLMKAGFDKFIVNLGGNLYCSGTAPEGKESFKVGIKDPVKPNLLCAKVDLKAQAVSTSGNYEQFIIIDGKRYTHIIDPRSGYPVAEVDAVTVISPSAALCDILSTAVFVEGEKLIAELHKKIKNLNILFIDIKENSENHILKDGLFKDTEIKLH